MKLCHFRYLLVAAVLTALCGCERRVELLSELSERDANEVVAVLSNKQIEATKNVGKDGVSVIVDSLEMPRAVRMLEAAGLPRRSRTSFGDVFKKEGVISTPLEERARYIYATSQELESTLSLIDGVVVARVHVVLPERIAPGEPVQPASAAVFIKHRSHLDPDVVKPRVRRMMQNSIPGLAENQAKLSVVFLPAEEYKEGVNLSKFGPFLVPNDSLQFWQRSVVGAVLGLIMLVVFGCYWLKPEWFRMLTTPTGTKTVRQVKTRH
ncbi:MAG: type III secretion inner membrane ring lipoprotein SctJ [Exilibacterium sp.]